MKFKRCKKARRKKKDLGQPLILLLKVKQDVYMIQQMF